MATGTGTGTGTAGAKRSAVAAILYALRQRPDATAAELAEFAGIGRSTADRVLASLEAEGRALRQRDTTHPGQAHRAAARWVLTIDGARTGTADQEQAETQAVQADADSADAVPAEQPPAPSSTPEPDVAVLAAGDADHGVQDAGQAPGAKTATAEAEPEAEPEAPPAGQAKGADADASGPRLRPGALRDLVHAWLAERPGEEFTPTRIGKELGRSAGAVGNALVTLTEQGKTIQTSAKPRRYTLAPPNADTPAVETQAATAPATTS